MPGGWASLRLRTSLTQVSMFRCWDTIINSSLWWIIKAPILISILVSFLLTTKPRVGKQPTSEHTGNEGLGQRGTSGLHHPPLLPALPLEQVNWRAGPLDAKEGPRCFSPKGRAAKRYCEGGRALEKKATHPSFLSKSPTLGSLIQQVNFILFICIIRILVQKLRPPDIGKNDSSPYS